MPLDAGARNIYWCRRRIRRLHHYHRTWVQLFLFHCSFCLFTMLQETRVELWAAGIRGWYKGRIFEIPETRNRVEDRRGYWTREGKNQAYWMILWLNFFRHQLEREYIAWSFYLHCWAASICIGFPPGFTWKVVLWQSVCSIEGPIIIWSMKPRLHTSRTLVLVKPSGGCEANWGRSGNVTDARFRIAKVAASDIF